MKILYLIHAFYPESYSGTEKFIFNISKRIQNSGHEVKIITFSFYDDSFYDEEYENILMREFKYEGLPVLAFKFKNSDKTIDYDLDGHLLRKFSEKVLIKEGPDIIHVGHSMRVAAFIRAARVLNIPYILTLTDFYLICPKIILLNNQGLCSGPNNGIKCEEECLDIHFSVIDRLRLAREIFTEAKGVFVPSEFIKEIFQREFKKNDIKVINHGIDISKIKKNNRIYKKGDKLTLGYAGALTYHKGVHLIIRALSKVNSSNCDTKIYGSGENELFNLLIKKNRLNNIELCGVFTEDMVGDIFSKLDVVIVPSIWNETYCFVAHEALSCNVPVIASNLGALPEKVKNGVNGFAFDSGNYNQLAKIIKLIIENPEVLNSLKENIKNSQIKSLEDEALQYEKEYLKIISDRTKNFQLENVEKSSEINLKEIDTTLSNVWDAIYYLNEDDKDEYFIIKDKEWKCCIENVKRKVDIDEGLLNTLRYKLDCLRSVYKDEKINYVIWGASNSGKITKAFIEEILPNFKLLVFIDKYKEGYFEGIKIVKPNDYDKLSTEYTFISTTHGKKEVEKFLMEKGLHMIDDYMYGYGIF